MTTSNSTSREARKAELLRLWNRDRNSHLAVIRQFRKTTGSDEELQAGQSVIELILDAEFGPAKEETLGDASEHAA